MLRLTHEGHDVARLAEHACHHGPRVHAHPHAHALGTVGAWQGHAAGCVDNGGCDPGGEKTERKSKGGGGTREERERVRVGGEGRRERRGESVEVVWLHGAWPNTDEGQSRVVQPPHLRAVMACIGSGLSRLTATTYASPTVSYCGGKRSIGHPHSCSVALLTVETTA